MSHCAGYSGQDCVQDGKGKGLCTLCDESRGFAGPAVCVPGTEGISTVRGACLSQDLFALCPVYTSAPTPRITSAPTPPTAEPTSAPSTIQEFCGQHSRNQCARARGGGVCVWSG